VAGARPGLQNRCEDGVTTPSDNDLGNTAQSPTAQGQRAASNDPDLSLINEAWPNLPNAVKSTILMLMKAASAE
jgi:hypothetical protein